MLYSCKVQATGSRLKYGSPARLRRYDLDDNVDQPKKVPMKRAARTRLAERQIHEKEYDRSGKDTLVSLPP